MKTLNHISILCVIIITCLGCVKDETQAVQSLEGMWEVNNIVSQYGEFRNNTFVSSDQINETGQLGTFMFNDDEVEFEFMRNDTLYAGNESWTLTSEKVNSGFTRVREYTLTISDQFVFDVFFGDGTSNSEKNANEIQLTQDATEVLPIVISMQLSKN